MHEPLKVMNDLLLPLLFNTSKLHHYHPHSKQSLISNELWQTTTDPTLWPQPALQDVRDDATWM